MSIGYAEDQTDIIPESGSVQLTNDNFRRSALRIRNLETDSATIFSYFTSGILQSSHGGTSANLSACAQGSVPYFNALGVMTCLTPGTSGQFLKTLGSGANPLWATQTTPALTLASVTTLSSANPTATISIDSTKQYYVRAVLATTQNDNYGIIINGDTSTNYKYVIRGFNVAATAADSNDENASHLRFGIVDGSTHPLEVDFYIGIQSTASTKPLMIYGKVTTMALNSTSKAGFQDFMGFWAATASATTFAFNSPGGGAALSGTVYLYELSKS